MHTMVVQGLKEERRLNLKLNDLINEHYGLSMLPEKPVYAMAYVPFQAEQPKLYSPDQGLVAGTMFPKLDKPFFGRQWGEKS